MRKHPTAHQAAPYLALAVSLCAALLLVIATVRAHLAGDAVTALQHLLLLAVGVFVVDRAHGMAQRRGLRDQVERATHRATLAEQRHLHTEGQIDDLARHLAGQVQR